MLRETEMSIRRRAEVVDQLAAVLIQAFWSPALTSGPKHRASDRLIPFI